VHMGGYRGRENATVDRCYREVYRMLTNGDIDPLISELIPLADLPPWLQKLADRATTGRLVVDPTR
ncbi:MAG: NADPH:quinone oxidoreductase family protein, partial [Acidimicrobiales bacterium]